MISSHSRVKKRIKGGAELAFTETTGFWLLEDGRPDREVKMITARNLIASNEIELDLDSSTEHRLVYKLV